MNAHWTYAPDIFPLRDLSFFLLNTWPCFTQGGKLFICVYYSYSCPFLCRSHLTSLSAVNVWNKNAHKLVGYTPEEVMGKNLVREFITDEFKTAMQAVLDQALHGEETANFEFPLLTKHGVRLDVLLNATTRRDEQGNIIGVVGIGQDVSTFCTMSMYIKTHSSHTSKWDSNFYMYVYLFFDMLRLLVVWPKNVNIHVLLIRPMLPFSELIRLGWVHDIISTLFAVRLCHDIYIYICHSSLTIHLPFPFTITACERME